MMMKIIGNSSLLTMSVLPKKAHPQTDFILDEAKNIAKSLGIISKGYASYSTFIPDLFPEAPTDRVIDVTVFFNTLYYLNTFFGEDTFNRRVTSKKPEIARLVKLWETGVLVPSPIPEINNVCTGILWFRTTLMKKSNKQFFKKITKNLFTHLYHALNPFDYKTIDEYIMARRWSGGMDATINLYEYVYENYIPDEILKRNPYMNRLNYICNLHPTLSNDVFSYPSEQHSRFNLIAVFLETNHASDFEDSVHKVIKLVNTYDQEFKYLYDNRENEIALIDPAYQAKVRLYIESLRNCMAASYYWQISTARYKHKNHFLSNLRIPAYSLELTE
ncbi:MAG: hypothetical protein MK212_03370 [Saprospiraceae bacterium]|nr:hypothetical protein [Saprospiraceae bacterium]